MRDFDFVEADPEHPAIKADDRWNHIPAPSVSPPVAPPPVTPPPVSVEVVSCFLGDTQVWLDYEGNSQRIDRIFPGDMILSGFDTNIQEVEAVDITDLGRRPMYAITVTFGGINTHVFRVSDEHPFWVPAKGWCPINSERYLEGNLESDQNVIVDRIGTLECWPYPNTKIAMEGIVHDLRPGDKISGIGGLAVVVDIQREEWPIHTRIFSLVTTKNTGSMVIGPGLWAMAWPDGSYPYRNFLDHDHPYFGVNSNPLKVSTG